MPAQLQSHGAQPQRQPLYVPIFIDKAFTGIFTQRNVLHDPSDFATSRFYGGRPDALWMGSNVELTNRLTLQRRPGLSSFSTATYPTPPDRSYSFQLLNGTIQVIVDTGSTGSLTLTSVNASIGSIAVYNGTITGGAGNAFAGLVFSISGFLNGNNNGTFTCSASTATTLTLSNASSTLETDPATAISTGAVFVDNQNGTKTLLFAKTPGAGQAYFQAVAGVLYIGDGTDVRKYTPGNTNGTIWDWGIVPPSAQPGVTITPSASAATVYTANTFWSTMGLIYDSGTGTIQQVISVNSSGTNTTQFGTTGNGQPAWNQTPGGTTTDNTITWVNKGPVKPWTANTLYNNNAVGGTLVNPCAVWDPSSGVVAFNINPGNSSGVSGGSKPSFPPINGAIVHDGSVKWYVVFPVFSTWKKSHTYDNQPAQGITNNSAIFEPIGVPSAGGTFPTQTVFYQASEGGTSASSATAPPFSASAGLLTNDGDLVWLSLGSGTWAANTAYSGWSVNGSIFSAIKDTNGNFQVCTTTGTSAAVIPGTSYSLTAAANASGGNTVYSYSSTTPVPVGSGNLQIIISGFTTPANNGTFKVVSSTATSVTVNNPSGVSESHAATGIYNPWEVAYGKSTSDGTAVWTSVGFNSTWAASTKWYLPAPGFSPPSASSPYGGASVNDSNNDVEFIVESGLGGGSAPSWNGIGFNTADNGTALTLTQVTVSGSSTTYTGTITGGGSNAFAGRMMLIAGFTNFGNNIFITVTASTTTTLVCTTTTQGNETHAGTATYGPTWYNVAAATTQSLSWTKGHVYAYSFKARSLTDFYSVAVNGVLPIPPGLSTALPTPTGSETNAISTASPVFTITGANTGAVNTITGLGSTDPQADTIVIWRDADGGGPSQMFELTEIPAPQPINGVAQTWTFRDFLPDTPTSLYPGLNPLIPAPIDESNNPPLANFLPMVYNFQRIWGAIGQEVNFSGGPDVRTGNSNEAFAPADELPFLANVVRLVKTSQGLITFLTDSIELIAGGPATASFYSVTLAPGTGLLSYNALDQYAGEIYFFSSDNRLLLISPALNISNSGFPIGDQLANRPSSGVSDTSWNPANVYVAILQNGIDNCLFVADGSTGWYRQNPHQVPGGAQGPEPIWSPYATITNGCKMVQTVETSPGIKQLLVGGTGNNQEILKRDLSLFTDNGSQYDANFIMGSIVLAHPGQIAIVKFVEVDLSGVAYTPTISFLMNEISGTFSKFVANPTFDPPSLYGTTITPTSYSPNRYYLSGNAQVARCRHMQVKVDFGRTSNGDELYDLTIFGRILVET